MAKIFMLRIFLLFIVLIFTSFFFVKPSFGVEVKGLYQAKVIVENQSPVIRAKAIKEAMKIVLVKVSGQKNIVQQVTVKELLLKAKQYLILFHYENIDEQLHLVVDFNNEKIDSFLKENNIAIWGSLRPKILVWLVNEQGLQRDIISSHDDNDLTNKFLSYSQQRGLPLYFPLMDLEDNSTINIADIWGRFVEPVIEASTRYQPEKVVIIRMSDRNLAEDKALVKNSIENDALVESHDCGLLCEERAHVLNEKVVDWSIIENHQTISKPYIGGNIEKLIENVVDDIIEHIYQQYAFQTGDEQKLTIEVNNVDSIKKLVEIVAFFESLSSIESASLVYVKGTKYRFELVITGSPKSLLSSLTLSRQLSEVSDPLSDPFIEKTPEFLWQNK